MQRAKSQGREAARRGARTLDSLPYGLDAEKKEGTAILGRTLLFAQKRIVKRPGLASAPLMCYHDGVRTR